MAIGTTFVRQGQVAAQVLRIGAVVAKERLRPPRPATSPESVPASVDHLTCEWLTAVLCDGHPDATVVDFQLGQGSDGTSSRRALTVRYNDAGKEAGLPTHLYTKSSPGLTSRLLIGITEAAAAEVLFYTKIRPRLDVGGPVGYYGAYDPRTCHSMILIEDIATTRGATFGDASTYVTRSEAESMVREMAAYHGACWNDPRLDTEYTQLRDAESWQANFNQKIGFDRGAVLAMRLAEDEIPRSVLARRKELAPALMRSLAINVRGARTLLHQDTHPANWLRLPDGTMALYDWQGIAKGGWALDYSYAISAALEIEDRRAWERELLELYLEELAARGASPVPTFHEAWLAYRQQMFHGFIFWLYTLGVVRLGREIQPEGHCRTLIRRIGQAIEDLGSFESLEAAGA